MFKVEPFGATPHLVHISRILDFRGKS